MLCILLVLSIPLNLLAQESEAAGACAQAKADAKSNVNSTMWMGAGCLGGVLGLGAAYVMEPSPPTTALLGKSPEYVAHYTDCYKEEAKSIQTSNAMKGCLIAVASYAVFWVVYFVVIAGGTAAAVAPYY